MIAAPGEAELLYHGGGYFLNLAGTFSSLAIEAKGVPQNSKAAHRLL